MDIINILIMIFGIFALSRVLKNIKSKNKDKIGMLFWIIFWITIIFVTLFPGLIDSLFLFIGIESATEAGLYGMMILLAYMIFRMYIKIEETERKITKIVRTIAIKNDRT
jgi:small membrane protein